MNCSVSAAKVSAVLLCVLLISACSQQSDHAEQSQAASSQPNILLVVADDLGYTDLGAFGGEISTPALDQLAYVGVRFTNFHTSASCAPTRAMLMTGTDNHLAGMGSQSGLATERQARHRAYRNALLPEVPTFVEHLRAAGYRTYMSGKWHLGHDPESQPHARGFDRSFALMEGGGNHFNATPLFESYGQSTWLDDGQPSKLPQDFYSSDYLVSRLIGYLEDTPQDQPYFAYLSFTAPHWPLQAPAETIQHYRGRYRDGWDELRAARMRGARDAGVVPADTEAVDFEPGVSPWSELSPEVREQAMARMEVYAAMVHRLDENMARLTDYLEQRGDKERTIIIFTADNGAEAHDMESTARHGTWLRDNFDNSLANIGAADSYVALQASWARATAAPFRASKSKVSEGGIRVPAFAVLPGGQSGLDDSYMRVMDIGPTLLAMAGAEPLPDAMGRSLLPRWLGGEPAYREDEPIAFEVYGRRGVQRGNWKLLLQEDPYGSGDWQLYNLEQDLGEQHDLRDERPDIAESLIQQWHQYAEQVGVVLPEHPIPY